MSLNTAPVTTRQRLRRLQRVNGRKCHNIVDTLGLLVSVHVTPANTRDATGAYPLLGHAAETMVYLAAALHMSRRAARLT